MAATHTSSPGQPSSESNVAIGSQVGRYVIKKRLGQGAMGEVFSAFDRRLERQVAVKLLRSGVQAVHNHWLRQRLEREAQALARLSHPSDGLFVAMDYVEGQTLTDWLRAPAPGRRCSRSSSRRAPTLTPTLSKGFAEVGPCRIQEVRTEVSSLPIL